MILLFILLLICSLNISVLHAERVSLSGLQGTAEDLQGKAEGGGGPCNRVGMLKVLWHNSLGSPVRCPSPGIYLFINACPIRGHPSKVPTG